MTSDEPHRVAAPPTWGPPRRAADSVAGAYPLRLPYPSSSDARRQRRSRPVATAAAGRRDRFRPLGLIGCGIALSLVLGGVLGLGGLMAALVADLWFGAPLATVLGSLGI
jgi:hypothetical protein